MLRAIVQRGVRASPPCSAIIATPRLLSSSIGVTTPTMNSSSRHLSTSGVGYDSSSTSTSSSSPEPYSARQRRLSYEERRAIQDRYRSGQESNLTELGKEFGIHASTVSYTLERKSCHNQYKLGPYLKNEDFNARVKEFMCREPGFRANDAAVHFVVGKRTISALCERLKISMYKYGYNPTLSIEERESRLQFARRHINDDWTNGNLIIGDEVYLHLNERDNYTQRTRSSHPSNIHPHFARCNDDLPIASTYIHTPSLAFFGVISTNFIPQLIEFPVNAKHGSTSINNEMSSIIEDGINKAVIENHKNNRFGTAQLTYIHDNAHYAHTPNIYKALDSNGIQRYGFGEFPLNSLDLNLMDSVIWPLWKAAIYKRRYFTAPPIVYKDVDDLRSAAHRAWQDVITTDVVKQALASMKKRCQTIIDNHGLYEPIGKIQKSNSEKE
jgi:hypothetical protein